MPNTTDPESWYARCRLAWIERQAMKAGYINRSDIVGAFGGSIARASADFKAYVALNPGALVYDTFDKCYYWSESARLVIVPAPWESLGL